MIKAALHEMFEQLEDHRRCLWDESLQQAAKGMSKKEISKVELQGSGCAKRFKEEKYGTSEKIRKT